MLSASGRCQRRCWSESIFIKGLVLCRFIKAFSQSAVAPVGRRAAKVHPAGSECQNTPPPCPLCDGWQPSCSRPVVLLQERQRRERNTPLTCKVVQMAIAQRHPRLAVMTAGAVIAMETKSLQLCCAGIVKTIT